MGNIEIQYPVWYILLCLIIGGAFALVLYYRASNFPEERSWVKIMLGFIRFLAITLLCFLLLSPVLRNSTEETEKPIVVVAQDESLSIQTEMDSQSLEQYKSDLNSMIDHLSRDNEVKTLSFGEEVRENIDFTFADRSSNQAAVLEYIGDLYGDQNLGAIVYATDGIYNEGIDPLYSNMGFSAPVYTIALGDTTPDKDLYIRQIFHNNISYLGDRTTIQVDVSSYNCLNQVSTLTVYRIDGDEVIEIESESFRIDDEDYFRTFEMTIPQEYVGLQRYRVRLDALGGEKTTLNNRRDFFIDVIDARQKILLLAASPHPDIAALKSTLTNNENYEVVSATIDRFEENLQDFDFVVLHQLPARGNVGRNVLRQITELNIPRMLIVGSQTRIPQFNQYQDLVEITMKGLSSNPIQAHVNTGFSVFTISDNLQQEIGAFAPLDAPFGEFSVNPAVDILLRQKVGKIDTDFPLWIISDEGDVRQGVVLAEGLWRWRLYDYLQHENTNLFDELVGKTIQYLTLKEDKRKFRVFQAKNLLAENEDALFDAELYNQSYELINEPEVTMTIYNAQREAFNFGFSRKNNSYSLNAGKLPAGDYTWNATTSFEGENYNANGQFSVQTIEKESYATVANHNILRQLAERTNGQMIYPSQVSELTATITDNADLKPLFYRVFHTRNAIHIKWIFFLLLALLVAEWAFRRYFGSY